MGHHVTSGLYVKHLPQGSPDLPITVVLHVEWSAFLPIPEAS
jgi:hypothetical protein